MKRRATKTFGIGCILMLLFLFFAFGPLPQSVRGTVTTTIPVGTQPESVAMTPDGAFAYVTNYGNNSVSMISTATNTVTSTVTDFSKPFGIAISPNGAYAYITNFGSNLISVMNLPPSVSIAPVGQLTLDVDQIQVFTATASGGSGSLTYQWYLDNTAVGGNSTNFSYTASGTTHSVTCAVTDSASSPITSTSNAVSVNVNPVSTPTQTTPSTHPTSNPTQNPTSQPVQTVSPTQQTSNPTLSPLPSSIPEYPYAIIFAILVLASISMTLALRRRFEVKPA